MFAMFFNFSVWVTDVFSAYHIHGVLGPRVPHEANGLPPPPLIDSVLVYPGRDFPGIFVLPSCGTEIISKALYQIFLPVTKILSSMLTARRLIKPFGVSSCPGLHRPLPSSRSCSSSVPSKRSSVGRSPPMPPTTTRAWNKPAITWHNWECESVSYLQPMWKTWYSHWKY